MDFVKFHEVVYDKRFKDKARKEYLCDRFIARCLSKCAGLGSNSIGVLMENSPSPSLARLPRK